MDKVISYAQNREDLYIASYFPDVKDGFYVDVGTHDPIKDSVTKHFYKLGWNGINIEPQQELFKRIKKDRKRDINLNLGVSNKAGKLTLREYPGGGLSTFSQEIKDHYAKDKEMQDVSYIEHEVEVVTLKSLLTKHAKDQHIHFMKVDVEGLEYEVLESNDWEKFRPELICIEANHIVKDWHPVLKKAKYTKVFFDGLNEYFLAKESLFREKLFCYPEKFLYSGAILPYEYAWQITAMKKELKKLYELTEKQDQTIGYKDREIYALDQKYQQLLYKYRQLESVRGAIKHSLKVVKGGARKTGKK